MRKIFYVWFSHSVSPKSCYNEPPYGRLTCSKFYILPLVQPNLTLILQFVVSAFSPIQNVCFIFFFSGQRRLQPNCRIRKAIRKNLFFDRQRRWTHGTKRQTKRSFRDVQQIYQWLAILNSFTSKEPFSNFFCLELTLQNRLEQFTHYYFPLWKLFVYSCSYFPSRLQGYHLQYLHKWQFLPVWLCLFMHAFWWLVLPQCFC